MGSTTHATWPLGRTGGLTESGALTILAADRGPGDGGAAGGPAVDELFERGRNWLSGVLIVAALGAAVGLAYPLLQRPTAPPVQLVATPPPAAPPASEVQVHIGGAVQQPGLYALPTGSRVADALQGAGAADGADLDGLNLAARVADGQRLLVPRRGEAPSLGAAAGPTGRSGAASAVPPGTKLNLNAATAGQLDA